MITTLKKQCSNILRGEPGNNNMLKPTLPLWPLVIGGTLQTITINYFWVPPHLCEVIAT